MKEKEKIIEDIFSRGVGELIDPNNSFKQKLLENGESVVIKFGVDVNRPDLHLGHAVVLRKLRKFQDLGAKIVFLVGDYTTMIGDPTGKSKVRPELSQLEVENNMKTYLDQVGKILKTDKESFSWIRNSEWFLDVSDMQPKSGIVTRFQTTLVNPNSFVGKAIFFEGTRMQKTHLKNKAIHTVSFSRIMGTLRYITHSRLIERDMFQDRIKSGQELYMHEMLYPVLQGIDSSLLYSIYGACDLEVGGTDQTFNMLMGRDVMRMNKQKEQAVLSFKLLVGIDGKEKMSKSLDNYVAITDEPGDMYGKIMSIPDTSILNYFELCTYTSMERIEEIKKDLENEKINPKDIKMELARQIVTEYHGSIKAKKAEEDFVTKFQKKEIPDDVEEIICGEDDLLGEVLIEKGFVSSKTEWRRLIEDGSVTSLSLKQKINDPKVLVRDGEIVKIGKHRFIKIVIL